MLPRSCPFLHPQEHPRPSHPACQAPRVCLMQGSQRIVSRVRRTSMGQHKSLGTPCTGNERMEFWNKRGSGCKSKKTQVFANPFQARGEELNRIARCSVLLRVVVKSGVGYGGTSLFVHGCGDESLEKSGAKRAARVRFPPAFTDMGKDEPSCSNRTADLMTLHIAA